MTDLPEQRERVSALMRHLRALGAGAELGCTVKQATERGIQSGLVESSVQGSVESSVETSEKILTLLQATSNMTTRDLAVQLGARQRAVEKQIEKFQREGRLQSMGPDNSGQWLVQKAAN
jgi:predicted HTH transcriptional regulator